MHKLIAVNVADHIDIKGVKSQFKERPIVQTTSELFLKLADNRYISIFNNGVISFANFNQNDINAIISAVKPYMKSPQENISETLNIDFEDAVRFEDDTIYVPKDFDTPDLLRLALYDLSQSIAIDYYSKISEVLLDEVEKFASELEKKGKLSISKKEMNKFIGKSLSTKNKIVNNLYIFDVPDMAWDNEDLDRVHAILSKSYDLSSRIKELQYTFEIIDDNLEMFKGMYEHSSSTKWEIVVVVLIIIEILQIAGDKFKWF